MRKKHRNVLRIVSNFTQLFATFAMGLLLVRLLLGLGESVYAVVAVLTAGAGMATLLRGIIAASMVPKLGEAWHSKSAGQFAQTFNSALVLSGACGVVTLLLFGAVTLGFSAFGIPPELMAAAKLFFALKAMQTLFTVVLGSVINMYLVTERMVQYNVFLTVERFVELLSAVLTLVLFRAGDPATCLIAYGIFGTAGAILLQLVTAAHLMMVEPRVRPRLQTATWAEGRRVLSSFGWNAAYVMAVNLHKRLDILIMSSVFGLAAGMMFSLAAQLTSYIRRLTMGLVVGLNAVSARLQSHRDSVGLRTTAGRQTWLQSCLIFPAMGIVIFAANDLFRLWIGNRIDDPAETIPMIAMICRVLLLGIAARSLSEGWMAILAGCGRVRAFSPFVLAGAIFNPLLILLGVLFIPAPWTYLAPAASFCTIYAIVHLFIVPIAAARHLGTTVAQLYRPCLGPLLSALFAAPVFPFVRSHAGQGISLFMAISAYSFAYAAGLAVCWKVQRTGRRLDQNRDADFVSVVEASGQHDATNKQAA